MTWTFFLISKFNLKWTIFSTLCIKLIFYVQFHLRIMVLIYDGSSSIHDSIDRNNTSRITRINKFYLLSKFTIQSSRKSWLLIVFWRWRRRGQKLIKNNKTIVRNFLKYNLIKLNTSTYFWEGSEVRNASWTKETRSSSLQNWPQNPCRGRHLESVTKQPL